MFLDLQSYELNKPLFLLNYSASGFLIMVIQGINAKTGQRQQSIGILLIAFYKNITQTSLRKKAN
jgi:hypothetical protein